MSDYLKGRTVRLRCRKRYPDAHTHIIMGRVEAETPNYLVLQGRAYHFRNVTDQRRSRIHSGEVELRAVPWGNVEVIHVLDDRTDFRAGITFDGVGNLVLDDGCRTVIALNRDIQES